MSGAPTDHKTAPVGIESLCLLQEAGSTGQFEGLFASSEGKQTGTREACRFGCGWRDPLVFSVPGPGRRIHERCGNDRRAHQQRPWMRDGLDSDGWL